MAHTEVWRLKSEVGLPLGAANHLDRGSHEFFSNELEWRDIDGLYIAKKWQNKFSIVEVDFEVFVKGGGRGER